MAQQATLTCQACSHDFTSQMPLTRSGSLGTTLMFLAENCTNCGDVATYMRWQYRIESAVRATRLSA